MQTFAEEGGAGEGLVKTCLIGIRLEPFPTICGSLRSKLQNLVIVALYSIHCIGGGLLAVNVETSK